MSWLNVNSNLQAGTTLINSVNRTKFNLLLKHIINSKNEEIFTPEELKKLQDLLNLDQNNLQLLILSFRYIWKQSSKLILKPGSLQKQLIEHLKLDPEKAEDFVKLWVSETKKDYDLEHQAKLENVAWELNLQSASSLCDKESVYNARIQLALADMTDGKKDNVVLELNEDELLNLYNTLENIQTKLDSVQ